MFGLYWPCRYYYDRPYRTVYIYESTPSVVAEEEYVVIKKPEPVKVDPQQVYVSRQAELFDQVLRDESEERVKAAVELGDYQDIASVAILIDVLINDADSAVRAVAATSLGKIGDTMAYEALLRSAEAEHEPQMQEAAQKASEIIKKTIETEGLYVYVSSVFPPMNDGKEELAQYLEDMRFGSDDVRGNAAKEMVNHKGTQVTAALLNTLINDDNDGVRKEAAESLGQIGDRMALPFLKWSCDNDPDESVRKEADKAVEKIYDTI
jgi:HEAT repeat protein